MISDTAGNANRAVDDETHINLRAAMARVIALQVVVLGLVRSHPNPQALRDALEPYAESARSNLLGFDWTDDQVSDFEVSLQTLCQTLPPASGT